MTGGKTLGSPERRELGIRLIAFMNFTPIENNDLTFKMSYVAMKETFNELLDCSVATVEQHHYLLDMLSKLSENLFDGRIPKYDGKCAILERDIDFWEHIRQGRLSPREITIMLWQCVYEFKSDRDFDYWFSSWPIEAQNFAIACTVWEKFREETFTFSAAIGFAREWMKTHTREAIFLLREGCRQAQFVHKGDKMHYMKRRRQATLSCGRAHKSWKRVNWQWISKLKEEDDEFVSAWMDVPFGPPEEPRIVEEPGKWARIVGWSKEFWQLLKFVTGRREAEMQMDEQPIPIPSKLKLKMMNLMRTFAAVMERHHEKMLVLCKDGRFAANTGKSDVLLYNRQSRTMLNAVNAFIFGRNANFPAYDLYECKCLPWKYSDESAYCKQQLNKWIDKIMLSTDPNKITKWFQRCVGMVRVLGTKWAYPFNPDRTKKKPCTNEEVDMTKLQIREAEMQSDETPVKSDVKSAPPTTGKPVAKASGGAKKKEYKNVKKAKVSGGIKKIDQTQKDTKVTLTMADTRSIQKEEVKKQVSKPKPESNPEKNNDMADIMKRPMLIARYTWDAAVGTKELAKFILPQAYFSHAAPTAGKVCQPLTAAHMMTQYGYTRFDLKVRVQINSNKFQRGLLLIWWQPFYTTERADVITWATKTNFPYTWMDASKSNSVEMIIPWTNMRDYFPLYTDPHSEYNYWGTLHMEPFTALATGEKSSPEASVSVFMSLVNWEVHQQVNPKPVDTVNFATEIMPDDFEIRDQQVRPEFPTRLIGNRIPATSASGLRWAEPQMEEMATGLLSVAGAHIMEGLLSKVSRVSADKPNGPKVGGKAKLEVVGNMVNGDGAEALTSLSLTQARTTPMRNEFLDTVAPTNLKELISKESWLTTVTITTSNKEGESLTTFTVSPCCQVVDNERQVKLFADGERFDLEGDKFEPTTEQKIVELCDARPTMLAYLANGFLRWTGDLMFRAVAVKTDLHTMRLGWRYEPTGTNKTASTECQKIATPGLIWDLNENNEIKFTASYVAPQPFLSTNYKAYSMSAETAQVLGNYACGIMELYVVNPLKVSTGVSQSIDVHIFISGAPNFEFSGLSSMAAIQCIGRNPMVTTTNNELSNYFEYHYGTFLLNYLGLNARPEKTDGNIVRVDEWDIINVQGFPFGMKLSTSKWKGYVYDKIVQNLKAADKEMEKILTADGFKPEVVTNVVVRPKWRPDTARTYHEAAIFLASHGVDIPEEISKHLNADQIRALKKWMVIAHMRHYALAINEVPTQAPMVYVEKVGETRRARSASDFIVAMRKKTEVRLAEMQMAEEAEDDTIANKPTPKEEGINPFKDGTTTNIVSVKELLGEDFNDMYKICRRYYAGEVMYAPRTSGSPLDKQIMEEGFMATCNDAEAQLVYWEFRLPVTPFIPFRSNGYGDVYCLDKSPAFTSQWDFPGIFGLDCRHEMTYNQQHLFAALHTFWRGEIRDKFILESDSESPVYGYAVHRPASYEAASVRLASHAMLRRAMNYGAVLYRGNVMGGFEVEIPWNQKYSRLMISNSRRSAISDNGTISIFLPCIRNSGQYRGATPPNPSGRDNIRGNLRQFKLSHFRAWGDNTELLVPRGAPKLTYYPYFTRNFDTDNWKDAPHAFAKLARKQGSIITINDVDRGVNKQVVAYTTDNDPCGQYMQLSDRMVPWLVDFKEVFATPVSNEEEVAQMTKSLRELDLDTYFTAGKIVKKTVEAQGDEEETSVKTTLTLAAESKDFHEFQTRAGDLGAADLDDVVDGAAQALLYSAGKLPGVIDKMNTNLERLTKTWSLTDKALEAWHGLTAKVGDASETVSAVGSFAYDATRASIVMYSFYQLLTAEDWQSKMMAITTGALALGLSIDLVKTVGQWLVSNVTGMFSSKEGMQAIEAQADEEGDQTVWEMLMEHQDSFKLFAAGAGALAVFYMTNKAPDRQKTASFATDMMSKLRNFTIVGAAVKTFDWLFKWIANVVETAFTWACDLATGGMLTRKILSGHSTEMLEWMMDIEKYNSDGALVDACWNVDEKMKFWKLFDTGRRFQYDLGKKNAYLNTTIQRSMVKIQSLENKMYEMDVTAPCRIDPFCIWLHGEPGVGKSAALATLISYMAEHMQWPKHNRTYSRNESDDFWSGYVGQPVVMIDDICQFVKSSATKDMIKMKSNVDYLLNMSESNEKGRRFTSQLIMCTSNQLYPVPEDMTKTSALWRRRNILATAYSPDGSVNDYTKLRFKLKIPDPQRADPNHYFADLSFPQFMASCYEGLKHHLSSQRSIVMSCLDGDTVFVPPGMDEECQEMLSATMELLVGWFKNHNVDDLPHHVKSIVMSLSQEEWDVFIEKHRAAAHTYLEARARWLKGAKWATALANTHTNAFEEASTSKKDAEMQGDHDTLLQNAEIMLSERRGISQMFMNMERILAQRTPVGKIVRYTNDEELCQAVEKIYPHATNKAEIVKRMKFIFEHFKTKRLKPTHSSTKYLIEKKWRQYFEKPDGVWKCKITEQNCDTPESIEEVEDRCELLAWWSSFSADSEPEVVQKALELAFTDVAHDKPLSMSARLLAKWFHKIGDRVATFWEDHPRIYSFMKIAGALVVLFGSYKVIKYMCNDWVEKIETKLADFFGLAKETAPVQYAIRKGEQGLVIGKDLVEKIRSSLWTKKDPILQAIPEGAAVALVSAEIANLIPTAVTQASLRKQAKEGEAQQRTVNAYTVGETVLKPKDKRPVAQKQQEILVIEKAKAVCQGTKDEVALSIRDAIRPNMCRLTVCADNKMRRLGGIFIRGRTLMCPLHFMEGLHEGDTIDVKVGELTIRESYSVERRERIGDLDVVLYECSARMPFKRDITKHFMTVRDMEMVTKSAATLHVLSECMDLTSWVTFAKMGPGVRYSLKEEPNYECTQAWEYEVGTRKGDCGGILLANNSSLARKIMGMHIAGIPNSDEGFALPLTKEELDETLSRMQPATRVINGTVEPQCFIEPLAEAKMIPEGNFTVHGKAKASCVMRLSEKTEIRKSPIHALVRDPTTAPAILTPKDARWVWDDTPLVRGVAKYGHTTVPFRKKDIDHAVEFLGNEFKKWKLVMEPKVISDYEAIFGNENIPYFDRMNMASSPGYPYVLKRPAGEKGKAYLYDVEAPDGIASDEYRKVYQMREAEAKEGRRSAHVWCACLKDERRPLKKIEEGKTRVFVLGAADYTQLMRKYFMAFNVNFYANHTRFFSAVGIDPYSYEWTKLWRRLTRKGLMGFGADYKNFDGHVDPELIAAFAKLVNNFFGEEPEENKKVRDVLIEECIHSVILMYNTFLEKHVGNPSGCAETTLINTIANMLYLMLAWIEIMRERCPSIMQLEHMWNYVVATIYGDDGVVGVHKAVQEIYNLVEVSRALDKHGITYTDEGKGDELYTVKPLADCTFLKNGFAKMDGRNVMLAPIAENTMYELINWVRASDDDVGQMRANFLDVFKFAFHHGKQFYDSLKMRVNDALAQRNLRGFAASYELQREEFLDACSF